MYDKKFFIVLGVLFLKSFKVMLLKFVLKVIMFVCFD